MGVGLVEAAAGAAHLLTAHRPRALVLVGTAGVFDGKKASRSLLGTTRSVGTATLLSGDVAKAHAFLPAPLPTHVAFDDALALAFGDPRTPAARVGSPLGITRTAALARRLGEACDLENLEAFAVGRAAVLAGVPCGAILGIANAVGPAGHGQWQAYGARAAAAACQVFAAVWERGLFTEPTRP